MSYGDHRYGEKTKEELKTQKEAMEEIGERIKGKNLKIALHNHTPEMENNAREFRYMMENIKADNIGACLDISFSCKESS